MCGHIQIILNKTMEYSSNKYALKYDRGFLPQRSKMENRKRPKVFSFVAFLNASATSSLKQSSVQLNCLKSYYKDIETQTH